MVESGESGGLPKSKELMVLVENYAEITGTSVDDCLSEALACWLLGTASERMRTRLFELEWVDPDRATM